MDRQTQMDTGAPLVMSVVLIGFMLGVDVWVWPLIADNARIATHWGFDGVPNGFAGKPKALLMAPVLSAVMTVLFLILPRSRRHRENLNKSASAYVAAWMGLLLILTVGHVLVILRARGVTVDAAGTTSFVVALVFLAIGNFLGKTKVNPYIGVRTPWTKRSAYSWEKSNRAAGRMMVACALATLACLVAASTGLATVVWIAGVWITAGVSVALSYWYWRLDPERRVQK